ncbi:hypothetical protein ACLMJK_004215 [Lecanora helva]
MASPYKLATDSPSRQLLWELSQIAISSQKNFYAHLDSENEEREAQHKQALAEASAQHERVRRSAEEFREKLELQIQAERRRKEEESRRELERQRQEKVAEEEAARKRQEERARAAELDAKRAAEARKAQEAALEKQKREKEQRDAEEAKRLREEWERREHPIQQPASAARSPPPPATVQKAVPTNVSQVPSQPSSSSDASCEVEHARYLQIHENLKELRQFMTAQSKQNPELKTGMGEMRRQIKKSVGQIREGKGKGVNSAPLKSINAALEKALQLPEPTIDISLFLASPPPQTANAKGPALLLYLLNIFAKAIVAQFIDEAGVKPIIADAVGTAASRMFAADSFRWQGLTLIDILIAKMHVVCPILFGIQGDEQTKHGRERLGWWKDPETGTFVSEQRHFERMTGLAAGFASLSLRNYEKAKAVNPYPNYHYWKALARASNLPPQQITQTHFVVLKGMIENFEQKILQFFGDMGLVVLRHALIELPRRSPPSVASKALAGLVDVLKKQQKLIL